MPASPAPLAVLALAAAGLRPSGAAEYNGEYNVTSGYRYTDPDAHLYPPLPYDDDAMKCSAHKPARPPTKYRGVNVGGFLVLEPWIAPSLFYQFLDAKEPKDWAMDMYTFCQVLGPEEGNRQLRRHWQAWVTEDDIVSLKMRNIDTLRVPIADWMFAPYAPFAGCTDGSVDELNRLLGLAHKHGLGVMLDLHGVQGSQNSFDCSGRIRNLTYFDHGKHFEKEWLAEWMGPYDQAKHAYTAINWTRIDETLQVVRVVTDLYKEHPAVVGLFPLNEPHWDVPIGPLLRYNWEAYKIVSRRAPHWGYVVDGSFRLSHPMWRGFMQGCDGGMIDMHFYLAWFSPSNAGQVYRTACNWGWWDIEQYNSHNDTLPLMVAEWSLATDNCAMWINGVNDGWPPEGCRYERCDGPSYLGEGFPGTPLDSTKALQGPIANPLETPMYGTCPVDRPFKRDSDVAHEFGRTQLDSWETYAEAGWFFWNFKTELHPKWDYLRSTEAGWLPMDAQQARAFSAGACDAHKRQDFTTALWLIAILASVVALGGFECYRMRSRRLQAAASGAQPDAKSQLGRRLSEAAVAGRKMITGAESTSDDVPASPAGTFANGHGRAAVNGAGAKPQPHQLL